MLRYRKLFTKKQKITGLILAIFGAFFFIAAKYQSSHPVVISAQKSAYKSIIFDLGDVLFTSNPLTKHKLIATTLLSNPSLLYYLINFDSKSEYFKFLHTIPASNKYPVFYHSEAMPPIMADWQSGLISGDHALQTITSHLNQAQHPTAIKNLFSSIASFMFSSELLAQSQQPIDSMVRLAQALKNAGYKLYALSNWDEQSFEQLHTKNSEIFNLFDGIVVSGQEKMAKPNLEFFNCLLNRYNVHPATTIFIDDEPNNIATAKTLGITSILCDKPSSVTRELINLGIITLQP